MKKAFVVSLAVLTIAALFPQDLSAEVGLKGGLNFAQWNYSGDGALPFKTLKGPAVGAFFTLGLGPISLQPEIYYSRRGAMEQEGLAKLEYRLDYIEVPVLVKLNLMPGPICPVVFGGAYGSLLLSAKGIYTDEEGTVFPSEDVKEFFTGNDYGIVFGGGLEIKMAVVKLIVDARYIMGMSNILEDEPDETLKNKGFSVLVGIAF